MAQLAIWLAGWLASWLAIIHDHFCTGRTLKTGSVSDQTPGARRVKQSGVTGKYLSVFDLAAGVYRVPRAEKQRRAAWQTQAS